MRTRTPNELEIKVSGGSAKAKGMYAITVAGILIFVQMVVRNLEKIFG